VENPVCDPVSVNCRTGAFDDDAQVTGDIEVAGLGCVFIAVITTGEGVESNAG